MQILLNASAGIKILLIGNKIDLKDERAVSTEEAIAYAKENNLFYCETSSKTNEDQCVQKAFRLIFEETVENVIR